MKPCPTQLPRLVIIILAASVIAACSSGGDDPVTSTPAASGNTGSGSQIEQLPDPEVSSSGDGSGLPGTSQTFIDQALGRINSARANPRFCGMTAVAAQPALIWNAKTEAAALGHSEWMQQTESFAHTGANDTSPGDRLTAAGYSWGSVAENIAAGYADLDVVIDGWLNSPDHCVNIMSASVSEFAIAVVDGTNANTYTNYWTMVLADPL